MFTPNVIFIVGFSIEILVSGSGLFKEVIVSPIANSLDPETAAMSPAITYSTSCYFKFEKVNNLSILNSLVSLFNPIKDAGINFFNVPLNTLPIAIEPRWLS